MKVTVNKIDTTTNTVSWDAGLIDENGIHFATMSGKVDSTRPFGSISLTVHNQSVFKTNEEAARAAYAQFVNEFNAEISTINPLITTNNEGEITV